MSYRASGRAYNRERVTSACRDFDRIMAEIPDGLSEADYRNYLARKGFGIAQIDACWRGEEQKRKAAQ
jgi:hypothetical protein